MTKKGIKPKLSDAEREQRKQEKMDRFKQFAPKRMIKFIRTCNQVANLSHYPITQVQKDAILKEVDKSTNLIKQAFAGKVKAAAVFEFPEETE